MFQRERWPQRSTISTSRRSAQRSHSSGLGKPTWYSPHALRVLFSPESVERWIASYASQCLPSRNLQRT